MESLFAYSDYRRYLADYFAARKRLNPRFSLRALAERSGFKARDYLMRVMRGERNLSLEGADKLSAFFRFSEKQANYFRALVQFNQARTPAEKERGYARLAEVGRFGSHQRARRDRFAYLSAWHHGALRALLPALDPPGAAGRDDWERLGRRLDPPLSAKRARDSVALLLRLGLVARDARGRYSPTETALAASEEEAALGTAVFQRAALELAKRSLDAHPPGARDLSGLTLGLSGEGFRRIRAEIRAFRKRVRAIAASDGGGDRVYQLGLHFIPLTRARGDA